jgi:ribosomal protein S18 acetylase RimI-like enzyme
MSDVKPQLNPVQYQPLTPEHFADVIALGNQVHGDGYLSDGLIRLYYQQGQKAGHNAGVVALDNQGLAGFRLAFAPGQWQPDQWCSPQLWGVPVAQVGYFKCNTVRPDLQGSGIGGALLKLSIQAFVAQGAVAGVAHLWVQSPGNAAVRYFSKHGGELVKIHPDKWREDSLNGYECVRCGFDCHCDAAEMILRLAQAAPG